MGPAPGARRAPGDRPREAGDSSAGTSTPARNLDAAAYRELAEETGIRVAPQRRLELWQEFSVYHAAYESFDDVRIYTAPTPATDSDMVVGEGRQIVFVDPAAVGGLPLTASASRILPEFLASDRYRSLCP